MIPRGNLFIGSDTRQDGECCQRVSCLHSSKKLCYRSGLWVERGGFGEEGVRPLACENYSEVYLRRTHLEDKRGRVFCSLVGLFYVIFLKFQMKLA